MLFTVLLVGQRARRHRRAWCAFAAAARRFDGWQAKTGKGAGAGRGEVSAPEAEVASFLRTSMTLKRYYYSTLRPAGFEMVFGLIGLP